MDIRKLKIYFQTKTDFLDDFLPNGSLCIVDQRVQQKEHAQGRAQIPWCHRQIADKKTMSKSGSTTF